MQCCGVVDKGLQGRTAAHSSSIWEENLSNVQAFSALLHPTPRWLLEFPSPYVAFGGSSFTVEVMLYKSHRAETF
jgi:hypothetical protein